MHGTELSLVLGLLLPSSLRVGGPLLPCVVELFARDEVRDIAGDGPERGIDWRDCVRDKLVLPLDLFVRILLILGLALMLGDRDLSLEVSDGPSAEGGSTVFGDDS